ncbi:hypothetical protein [Nonomuraea rubra]|uniref:hypothetical protein n=1 Tax=Nonomuraea rubra TaxID=46180 RepID=UPI0033EEA482
MRRPHNLPRDGVGRDLAAAFAELDLAHEWGDGTGADGAELDLAAAELYLQQAVEAGALTWADQVRYAVARVLAEKDPDALRGELLQAVALQLGWLYALDRRATWARPIPRVSRRYRRRRSRL